MIARLDADVVLLGDVDWDAGGAGLAALRTRLAGMGAPYDHAVALRPNSGTPVGCRPRRQRTAGRGRATRWATAPSPAIRASRFCRACRWGRWRTTRLRPGPPGALAPDGVTLPVPTVAQWAVPLAGTGVTLVTLAAGTPVFDGPEDRNGRRNAAELALAHGLARAEALPILLGRANVDPVDGAGRRAAMRALLDDPALQDPRPKGRGGGGVGHRGDPALDTAAWDGPGPLRVDYVLPSAALDVRASGVVWPDEADPFRAVVETAGTGRAVWVDVEIGPPSAGQ